MAHLQTQGIDTTGAPENEDNATTANEGKRCNVQQVEQTNQKPVAERHLTVNRLGRKEVRVDSRAYRLQLAKKWYKDRVLNAL